ncbi:MAG: PAS domain S-box protein [Myxococcales bacterium]|nr:PAS domain S-box protein [Myxococcales bacterium]
MDQDPGGRTLARTAERGSVVEGVCGMFDFFKNLFDTSDFPARWHCGRWTTGHGWLHISSDVAIWGAYTAIPLVIAYFVRRRRDTPFPRVFWLFALFIFACGASHLMEAIIFWQPMYRAAGVVKLLTAAASWATVLVLIDVAPQALRLPGLDKLNQQLRKEIEERNQAEREAREAAARLRAIVEEAMDGIITLDERGRIESMNPAVRRLFGYGPEELLGQQIQRLMPETQLTKPARHTPAPVDVHEDKVFSLEREVRGRRKDGSEFPLEVSVSEVRLEGRRIFSGILRDASERKRAEAEREALLESERTARAEAERANRTKDQFLQVISHELRNPLSAIIGYTQLLQEGRVKPEGMPKALAALRRNAKVQVQLIEDLLDMSRITSGKLRLDIQTVNPASVIEAAIDTVVHAAEAKRIRLHKELGSGAVAVLGDFDRLQQVVWNLLSNAVKFTPEAGEVRVKLTQDTTHVRIQVSDTGEGIKPEFLPYVFERFRQAEAGTTRRHGGLGLGLAIAKHIVELHGGSVSVVSAGVNQGTTFTVTLPLRQALQNEKQPTPAWCEGQGAVPTPGVSVDLSGLRVLVVDDDADTREFVRVVLEERRALVVTTNSAREALAVYEGQRPHVLLSDIGMPEVDGYELIRLIRHRSPQESPVPAAALTAFARSEDRTRALLAGYQAHVTKPVDPVELVAVIASLCGRTGRG